MVRPKASDTIRNFASALANTVSTASGIERDWIARTGRHSMFSLLTKLAPKVCIRSRNVVRDERLIEIGFPDQTSNYCHFELIQVNQIKTKSMNTTNHRRAVWKPRRFATGPNIHLFTMREEPLCLAIQEWNLTPRAQ